MHMQIFRVKRPSCKILKTKNCGPFEVQYTSSVLCLFLVVQYVTMVFPGHTLFLGKVTCIEYKDVLGLGSVYYSVSVFYILKIKYTIDPD